MWANCALCFRRLHLQHIFNYTIVLFMALEFAIFFCSWLCFWIELSIMWGLTYIIFIHNKKKDSMYLKMHIHWNVPKFKNRKFPCKFFNILVVRETKRLKVSWQVEDFSGNMSNETGNSSLDMLICICCWVWSHRM